MILDRDKNYVNMKTDEARRAKIKADLDRLNYAKGNGLLETAKKPLIQNEIYLFISSGGTGHKALQCVKELIERTVDPAYRDKVGYLVVDCAENEINGLIRSGQFRQDETVTVPSSGTHETIDPHQITPDKEEWVDSRLFEETGGTAPGSHPGFQENGAGAWRQPGRVRLASSGGTNFMDAIKRKVGSMPRQPGTGIKVFFLCSVAGGTGSGTIIDLAYMTRDVMRREFSTFYDKTRFVGFIFSPDACEGRGDTADSATFHTPPQVNHYAAMKEVDYLMRLNDRHERIKMRYGGRDVEFENGIFDVCFLVDGSNPLYSDPDQMQRAAIARETVAQSILGFMTSINDGDPSNPLGPQETVFDSMLSNVFVYVGHKIPSLTPVDRYPRYASYKFSAMGFASVKIPVELLTSALVFKVYEQITRKWNERPTDQDVTAFLENCGIKAKKKIDRSKTTEGLLGKIEEEANRKINKHSIFYVIDLALKAAKLLDDEGITDRRGYKYGNYARTKGRGWEDTATLLKAAHDHLIKLNNTVWETAKIVLETFRDLLEAESKIMTDVEVYNRNFNKVLCFTPINLTEDRNTYEQAQALRKFIYEDIYNEEQQKQIANDFVETILSGDALKSFANLAENSTSSGTSFDSANMIRNFIKEEFKEMINANIEEILVKFFSADANAKAVMDDPDNPGGEKLPTDALKQAARYIYDTLLAKGTALAQLSDNIGDRVFKQKYIMAPKEKCEHLFRELKEYAQTMRQGVTVYESKSDDEFIMVSMHHGIPAFAFNTTKNCESAYEQKVGTSIGLHIEQCGQGAHNWVNLPNLVFGGDQYREQQNLREAKADYDAAVALGMVMDSPNYPNQHMQIKSIFRLNKTQDVGSVTERWMTSEFEDYISNNLPDNPDELNIECCLKQLEQKQSEERSSVISRVDLCQTGDQPIAGADANLPDNFYYDYAWHTLRQMFHLWHAVKETIPYVEKLKDAIDAKHEKLQALQRMEARRTTFAQALRAHETVVKNDGTTEDRPVLIRFVNGRVEIKKDGTNWSVLTRIGYGDRKPNSRLYTECKEYFAFVAFSELPEADYNSIERQIEARRNIDEVWGADQERGSNMAQEFRDRSSKDEAEADLRYPMASVEFSIEAERIEEGLCDKLRTFYTNDIQDPIAL